MPNTAAVRKCAGAAATADATGRVVVAVGAAADSVERFAARGATAPGTAAVTETAALGAATLPADDVDDVAGTEAATAGADADELDGAACCAPTALGFDCGLGDLFLFRGALPVFASSAAAGVASLPVGVDELPPAGSEPPAEEPAVADVPAPFFGPLRP
ncbi:MAG: hypothetical protein EKK51_28535 [Mycolicibacterium sp.]|nr:MAG: hypothetical protein EKK51_28535 [Mycolicibacterium sp.]